MSLSELWSTSKTQLEGKQVRQIIAFPVQANYRMERPQL